MPSPRLQPSLYDSRKLDLCLLKVAFTFRYNIIYVICYHQNRRSEFLQFLKGYQGWCSNDANQFSVLQISTSRYQFSVLQISTSRYQRFLNFRIWRSTNRIIALLGGKVCSWKFRLGWIISTDGVSTPFLISYGKVHTVLKLPNEHFFSTLEGIGNV